MNIAVPATTARPVNAVRATELGVAGVDISRSISRSISTRLQDITLRQGRERLYKMSHKDTAPRYEGGSSWKQQRNKNPPLPTHSLSKYSEVLCRAKRKGKNNRRDAPRAERLSLRRGPAHYRYLKRRGCTMTRRLGRLFLLLLQLLFTSQSVRATTEDDYTALRALYVSAGTSS